MADRTGSAAWLPGAESQRHHLQTSTYGKLRELLEPRFPHLENGADNGVVVSHQLVDTGIAVTAAPGT